MRRALAVVVGLALLPVISGAQEANPYNGSWMARWTSPSGASMAARVDVKDAGGTWRVVRSSRGDNCSETDFPLVVKRATNSEFVFSVSAAQVLRGCSNYAGRATRISDKRLEGKFMDGTIITLER